MQICRKYYQMHKICCLATVLIVFILAPDSVFAQVYGKVLDEKGEPLPYATVYVRGTSNGTVTNAKGEYKLIVSTGPQEIVFQYIGYKTKVEKINFSQKPIKLNIELEASDLQLNEVVITSVDPAER